MGDGGDVEARATYSSRCAFVACLPKPRRRQALGKTDFNSGKMFSRRAPVCGRAAGGAPHTPALRPDLTGCGYCWHLVRSVSVTIQLDLPDALVAEAREAGLLESARLADWLADELRRKRAREEFGQMLEKLHSVADEPMSMAEIQAEVVAVREERRRREGSR